MAMGLHGAGSAGRGRRGRASRRAPMAEINVTPFVDVMLVLLIIFMVTAPLLTAGVPVDLPDSNARPLSQPEERPIDIALDANGVLFVDEMPTDPGNLATALAARVETAESGRTPAVTLRADKGLPYERVMAVMGDINRAGLTRVALVTTRSAATP